MERLDKIIASQTEFSRKEIKKLCLQGRVKVNNEIIKKSDIKIDEINDNIMVDEKQILVKKYIYLALNKPKGYISATEDAFDPVVVDLVPQEYKHRNLFPIGRLDKDTTGLIIITDDGEFAHNIIAPNKHVKKTYFVEIDSEVTEKMISGFQKGVKLKDEICKPAILEKISEKKALVTITEGKYHQIKRMFGCFGAKVTELKRLSIGNYELPNNLEEGCVIELTESDLQRIKEIEK